MSGWTWHAALCELCWQVGREKMSVSNSWHETLCGIIVQIYLFFSSSVYYTHTESWIILASVQSQPTGPALFTGLFSPVYNLCWFCPNDMGERHCVVCTRSWMLPCEEYIPLVYQELFKESSQKQDIANWNFFWPVQFLRIVGGMEPTKLTSKDQCLLKSLLPKVTIDVFIITSGHLRVLQFLQCVLLHGHLWMLLFATTQRSTVSWTWAACILSICFLNHSM